MANTHTPQNLIPFPNLPLLPNVNDNNDTDINGNVVPAVQIIRRNDGAPRRMCTTIDSKIKLAIFFCLFELITSLLYIWLYFSVTDSSQPKTFAWKQIQKYFYFDIKNSTDDCRHIRKSIPLRRETGIRPFLHSDDFCVLDKHLTICPYEVTRYWYLAPVLPLITFALPIVMTIMTVVHVLSRRRYHRENSTGRFTCPIYMISFLNPMIFIFGWLVQFMQHMIADDLKGEMIYGYDMMNSTSLSQQWELTQLTGHCCGFHSYRDWNITDLGGGYPHSCCNTMDYSCDEAPTRDQVWHQGCFKEEKNRFSYTAGMFLLLILFKMIFECGAICLLVDLKSDELQENSLIHCTNFGARAFGIIEITEVVTDNAIIATIRNFRSHRHNINVERGFHHVLLCVNRKGVLQGSVNIFPTNGLTMDDIIIHFDQSHRGVYEITTSVRINENDETEITLTD